MFSLIICLILAFSGSSTSTNIGCDYSDNAYAAVGSIYRCYVNNNPNILTKELAEISGVSGTHQSSKSNDDVFGISAYKKIIQFFPKGLKFFKNLKLILFGSCQLKEIHQSDLKPFSNLVYIFLYENKIEFIEAELFNFNPNLEVVGFQETEIIHIDPNVFDHLIKLRYFWFSDGSCVGEDVEDSREQVQEVIKIVKSNCSN